MVLDSSNSIHGVKEKAKKPRWRLSQEGYSKPQPPYPMRPCFSSSLRAFQDSVCLPVLNYNFLTGREDRLMIWMIPLRNIWPNLPNVLKSCMPELLLIQDILNMKSMSIFQKLRKPASV